MSNHHLFQSLPIFSYLSESDRIELERQAVEIPCQKGDYIFRERDPAEWFHIVKEGIIYFGLSYQCPIAPYLSEIQQL